jgi:hypothetical protein
MVDDIDPSPPPSTMARFTLDARVILVTWSKLRREDRRGLLARFGVFIRSRNRYSAHLACVEEHDPNGEGYDEEYPLHVHALCVSVDETNGWKLRSEKAFDFEGHHPNIVKKGKSYICKRN